VRHSVGGIHLNLSSLQTGPPARLPAPSGIEDLLGVAQRGGHMTVVSEQHAVTMRVPIAAVQRLLLLLPLIASTAVSGADAHPGAMPVTQAQSDSVSPPGDSGGAAGKQRNPLSKVPPVVWALSAAAGVVGLRSVLRSRGGRIQADAARVRPAPPLSYAEYKDAEFDLWRDEYLAKEAELGVPLNACLKFKVRDFIGYADAFTRILHRYRNKFCKGWILPPTEHLFLGVRLMSLPLFPLSNGSLRTLPSPRPSFCHAAIC
jgi:hypothetical protein